MHSQLIPISISGFDCISAFETSDFRQRPSFRFQTSISGFRFQTLTRERNRNRDFDFNFRFRFQTRLLRETKSNLEMTSGFHFCFRTELSITPAAAACSAARRSITLGPRSRASRCAARHVDCIINLCHSLFTLARVGRSRFTQSFFTSSFYYYEYSFLSRSIVSPKRFFFSSLVSSFLHSTTLFSFF